jgi:cyclopropane-fatty-acyl-phospholipid synthase
MSTRPGSDGGASAQAIEHHYDTGNDFYATFLDRNMVYSCALWEEGDSLEDAQLRKLDYHLAQVGAGGARRLLDVGSGWGALLQRATTQFGVQRAVGLTLSQAQYDYCTKRRLENVEVRLEDWRDHTPKEKYDAIVSIGAFEHFTRPGRSRSEREANYREFFRKCWQWLEPGCQLSLQTVSYDNMATESINRFIADEIFPESDLPRLSEIIDAADGLFSIVTLRNDAPHYEETSRQWLRRLNSNRDLATELVREPRYKQYVQFLTLVTMAFHTRNVSLLRILWKRLDKGYRAS